MVLVVVVVVVVVVAGSVDVVVEDVPVVVLVESAVSTTSCGGLAPSRLLYLVSVGLGDERPKLTSPLPLTAAVTSMVFHAPDVTRPLLPRVAPMAGADEYVIEASAHVVSATARTAYPEEFGVFA